MTRPDSHRIPPPRAHPLRCGWLGACNQARPLAGTRFSHPVCIVCIELAAVPARRGSESKTASRVPTSRSPTATPSDHTPAVKNPIQMLGSRIRVYPARKTVPLSQRNRLRQTMHGWPRHISRGDDVFLRFVPLDNALGQSTRCRGDEPCLTWSRNWPGRCHWSRAFLYQSMTRQNGKAAPMP
jgi:hypothetical protein